MPNILTVRTAAQQALFICELQGQLSDGFWENTRPHGHWIPWCRAEVVVGDAAGRNFPANKDNYNFNSSELLGYIGVRMLTYARLGYAGYDPQLIRNVLRYLFDENTGAYTGKAPTYEGEYYDKVRAQIKKLDLVAVKAAGEDDSYTMKNMRKDLAELKKIVRQRN